MVYTNIFQRSAPSHFYQSVIGLMYLFQLSSMVRVEGNEISIRLRGLTSILRERVAGLDVRETVLRRDLKIRGGASAQSARFNGVVYSANTIRCENVPHLLMNSIRMGECAVTLEYSK